MVYILIFLAEFLLLFLLSRIVVKNLAHFLLAITRNRNLAMRLFHIVLLPGVVIHELAHLIVSEILLVRTGNLSFSLEPQEDSMVMGSVGIEDTDPIRRAIIGFAPVFVGILIIGFSVFYLLSENSPLSFPINYLIVFFIVFEIGNTMFSSKRDLEGTAQLLIVISLAVVVAYFLGLRLPESLLSFFSSDRFIGIIQNGVKVLLFPLGINLTIILLARFLTKKY